MADDHPTRCQQTIDLPEYPEIKLMEGRVSAREVHDPLYDLLLVVNKLSLLYI